MDYSTIETFLVIAKTGSLTKAAEILYVSQSTVSYRLKSLEQKLGNELIKREQGKGSITLTDKGEEFITVAQMWKSLLNETEVWKTQSSAHKLKIGCTDSLNTCIFSKLYRKLYSSDPPIVLNIGSHWTVTIHEMIKSYEVDVGFVGWQIPSKYISSRPLFSERMVLISSVDSDFPASIHPSDLDPQNEIFLYAGPYYQSWHDYWWNNKRENSTVDTISLLDTFIDFFDFWSIVPVSTAKTLKLRKSVKISEIIDAPPERVCYQITNRNPLPTSKRSLEVFNEYLEAYMKSDVFNSLIK